MGCEINIMRITEYIKKRYEEKKEKGLWTLFIDLKSAFDTVDHKLLFEKMRQLNIDESLTQTIE